MVAPHPLLNVPPGAPVRDGIVDLAPEVQAGAGLAQRVMELPGVGHVYEAGIRPLLTRLVGGPRYAEEAAFLDRWLVPLAGPVLDVACGTGRYTRHLARRHGAERVIGLDISWPMLREARQQAPELCFVRGSAQALPLPDACLGAACTLGALHLFPDPEGALVELGRVLQDGAPLVVLTATEPDRDGVVGLLHGVGHVIRLQFLPRRKLLAGLEAGGLDVLAERAHGAMRLLAARRRGR